jgi:hypothetical protein
VRRTVVFRRGRACPARRPRGPAMAATHLPRNRAVPWTGRLYVAAAPVARWATHAPGEARLAPTTRGQPGGAVGAHDPIVALGPGVPGPPAQRAGNGRLRTRAKPWRWRTAAAGRVPAALTRGGRRDRLGLKPQAESTKPPLAAFAVVVRAAANLVASVGGSFGSARLFRAGSHPRDATDVVCRAFRYGRRRNGLGLKPQTESSKPPPAAPAASGQRGLRRPAPAGGLCDSARP